MPVSEVKSQTLNIKDLSVVAQMNNFRLRVWVTYFLYNVLFSDLSSAINKRALTTKGCSPFSANTGDASSSVPAAGTEGEKLSWAVTLAFDFR